MGETRRGREAQETQQSLRDCWAQTPGRPFFGYFLVAVDKKVTRHQGGTALSISGSNGRAQARALKFQTASDDNTAAISASILSRFGIKADRKSTRLNSSHALTSRMPSSA